jgi:hypothetical protein
MLESMQRKQIAQLAAAREAAAAGARAEKRRAAAAATAAAAAGGSRLHQTLTTLDALLGEEEG